MKTKTLKLFSTEMPDSVQTPVFYKEYELFGPGSRAFAPGSIDQQARPNSIAHTISAPGKADAQLLRGKTQTSD